MEDIITDLALFKRHYYKAKNVYVKVSQSGALTLNVESKKDSVKTSFSAPDAESLTLLVVLMRRFLLENDRISIQQIWTKLKNQYPDLVTKERIKQIDGMIERAKNGDFEMAINEDKLTAEKTYTLISNSDFFGFPQAEAIKYLSTILDSFSDPFFKYTFYTYNTSMFQVASAIFTIILEIEKSAQYKNELREHTKHITNHCIYCGRTEGAFSSEEHVLSESLGNYDTLLPKGFVCDTCNNEVLSTLDTILLKAIPLHSFYVPHTKDGKFPSAERYQSMHIKKTGPANIFIEEQTNKSSIKDEKQNPDGSVSFSLSASYRFIPKEVARAVYKVALGMVAYKLGQQAALDKKYDKAREFILHIKPFQNHLLLLAKSNNGLHKIGVTFWTNSGTLFEIHLYGFIFLLNLEEEPKLLEEKAKELGFISFPLF